MFQKMEKYQHLPSEGEDSSDPQESASSPELQGSDSTVVHDTTEPSTATESASQAASDDTGCASAVAVSLSAVMLAAGGVLIKKKRKETV